MSRKLDAKSSNWRTLKAWYGVRGIEQQLTYKIFYAPLRLLDIATPIPGFGFGHAKLAKPGHKTSHCYHAFSFALPGSVMGFSTHVNLVPKRRPVQKRRSKMHLQRI